MGNGWNGPKLRHILREIESTVITIINVLQDDSVVTNLYVLIYLPRQKSRTYRTLRGVTSFTQCLFWFP